MISAAVHRMISPPGSGPVTDSEPENDTDPGHREPEGEKREATAKQEAGPFAGRPAKEDARLDAHADETGDGCPRGVGAEGAVRRPGHLDVAVVGASRPQRHATAGIDQIAEIEEEDGPDRRDCDEGQSRGQEGPERGHHRGDGTAPARRIHARMDSGGDRQRRRAAFWLLIPALAVVGIVAAAPVGILLGVSLFPPGPLAPLEGGPELGSFRALAEAPYPEAALRTVRFALLTTAFTALLGFPAAWTLSRSAGRIRSVLTLLVVAPLLMSIVVRAYGWTLILGRQGFLGETLALLGLPRTGLLHTEAAVLLGLTEAFLPFMILALAAGLDRTDRSLVDAARGLGASPGAAFFRITLPLALPSLVSGAGFVMVGCLAAYATPALLGGSASRTLVLEIYELVTVSFDWPTAAAASLLLLAAASALLAGAAGFSRRRSASVFGT